MKYIAYGSNLNLRQMARRCPTATVVGTGWVHNYQLTFRGVATIVPKENSSVPVGIWEIDEAAEQALDRYEGYPHLYRKETIARVHSFLPKETAKAVSFFGKFPPTLFILWRCSSHR